jgi:ABC-type Mn2+/Zn2+ transport system permease subunit
MNGMLELLFLPFLACLILAGIHCYLVVPAVCAMFFVRTVTRRLLIGWGLGFVASVLGLYASAKWDLPTGASVVTVFGVMLVVCTAARRIFYHTVVDAR